MTVTCCPLNASHTFSAAAVLATICGDYCGPDCHAYGITELTTECIVCKHPPQTFPQLSSCEEDYTELVASSVTTPDSFSSSLCKGVTCHLCGTDLTLSGIPDGAHLYLTPTCAPFHGESVSPLSEITLFSPPFTVIRNNLTIHLQDSDTLRLVGHPPTIIGNLTIVSKKARLHLDTATSHCHLLVENGPVLIEPHISVTRGNCGISHFRATPPTEVSTSADFTLSSGLFFENCTRHCYTGAISNIVGTVSIAPPEEEGAEPATILAIETTFPDALKVLSPTKTFSVSKLLNVFGTDYEIEYACEAVTPDNIADCGDTIIDYSYEAVNRRLLPAALALIVIFLTNPSFGQKDE